MASHIPRPSANAMALFLCVASASAMATPSLTLKYFPFAGAAEKVRLAFWLGNVPFVDERVPFAEWAELKPTTPYGQVPVLAIDGGPYISQSMAMLRYAATLAPQLYPPEQALAIEESIGLTDDLVRAWTPALYVAMNPSGYGYGLDPSTALEKGSDAHVATVRALRERFVSTELPKFCGYFSERLRASGGPFLAGGAPTIADCYLVPELEKFCAGFIDDVPKDCLEPYPAICEYLAAFRELPAVQAYAAARDREAAEAA